MRKVALALLFGAFMGVLGYESAGRLYECYQTGQLVMHRKMPVGSDIVTYSGDPTGFLMELTLYLFLLVTGAFGVLLACRNILLEIMGPQSFFDLRDAYERITIFNQLLVLFLLIVFTFGVLEKLV
jgi:hypothetical protein